MRPYWRFSVSIHRHSSGVFVTPSGIAPASIMRWTVGAFFGERYWLRETRPAQLGIPFIAIASLIVQGTPWKGGSVSTSVVAATSASAASASSRAAS